MTFQSEHLERGLEGDEVYWIAYEQQVRTLRKWDPERDPPPDLAIEIEISRSALNRMGIHAALRVPEVWRCDGHAIRIYLLQSDQTYQLANESLSFPGFPVAEIAQFLEPGPAVDFLSVLRAFRAWVWEQLRKSDEETP
jgi:Uma2 family endonuclease